MPKPHRYNAPKVKESKGIQLLTSVWIVPFIAFIIALWLGYQYYSKIGPTIEIGFKENAGLVANQSQLKMRDVPIGMVTNISLAEDGNGVIVQVKVNKDVAGYLNEKAKFWIVHADVGSHGVSGLDTLISGSYIELYGVKEGETKHVFRGLEKPYIDKEAKGAYYILSAPSSNNISEGSNVYYRMVKVGRVERVAISPDGKKVNFTIFVKEQYIKYINNKSQFYTNSSISVDLSQGKLDMKIASISQLVHGGISVYTPVNTIHDEISSKKSHRLIYPLYKSQSEMKAQHLSVGDGEKIYLFKFKDKSNKLEVGSPVEFNGFQVGYVTEIENSFSKAQKRIDSKVYALINTKAFSSDSEGNSTATLEALVREGLKASLDRSVPMFGSDFINLIFKKNKENSIVRTAEYDIFPTIKKESSSNILTDTQKLIQKLEKLPLEKLLASATTLLDENNQHLQEVLKSAKQLIEENNLHLQEVLVSANSLIKENNAPIQNLFQDLEGTVLDVDNLVNNLNNTVNNLNTLTAQESLQNLPNELSQTLQELNNTLKEVQSLVNDYGADSKFSAELSLTLRELSLTAESMGRISQKLEKKPNALILGDD